MGKTVGRPARRSTGRTERLSNSSVGKRVPQRRYVTSVCTGAFVLGVSPAPARGFDYNVQIAVVAEGRKLQEVGHNRRPTLNKVPSLRP